MAPPTHLAYSTQLILHEPSFAEGAMLRTLHEEVLRKVAGGEALTKQHPVYGLCLCFARNHPLDSKDCWPVLLLSYWDCPGFDSNSNRNITDYVTVPEFLSTVWEHSSEFADAPETWEDLSHFELNLMLHPGHHIMPVYVTCTWCCRCYLGMPDLPPWSELIALSDSGAETPDKAEAGVSEESEAEW
eukprot:374170-Rhodomonas_salina.1